jgi:hypothetical protein
VVEEIKKVEPPVQKKKKPANFNTVYKKFCKIVKKKKKLKKKKN